MLAGACHLSRRAVGGPYGLGAGVDGDGVDGDDGRVTLSSSGRWVEVGAFLGPAERSQLARCLKEFLAAAAQGGGRNR